MEMPSFQFVNLRGPKDAYKAHTRLIVRTHAARARRPFRPQRLRPSDDESMPWMAVVCTEVQGKNDESCTTEIYRDDLDAIHGEIEYASKAPMQQPCSPCTMIGGTRVDPFQSYPIPWRPFLPSIVDHYLQNMAVDIAELDGPNEKGLLRAFWFPLIMTQDAPFSVVVLIAASHKATTHNQKDAVNLLRLRTEALGYVQQGLEDPDRCLSDQMIGAVAKLASYEAMYGTRVSYRVHMLGLKHMVSLRGGLDKLGLNGLLARLVIWIDQNGAFLTGENPFFEDKRDHYVPNPSSFLVMN